MKIDYVLDDYGQVWMSLDGHETFTKLTETDCPKTIRDSELVQYLILGKDDPRITPRMHEWAEIYAQETDIVPDEFSSGTLGDHRQYCAEEETRRKAEHLKNKSIEEQRAEIKKLVGQRDALLEAVSVAHGIIVVAKNVGPKVIDWEMTLKTLKEAYVNNGGNASSI